MKSNLIIWLVITFLAGGVIGWYAGQSGTFLNSKTGISRTIGVEQAGDISKGELDLKLAMRKLWEDHITWTRAYLISEASSSDDLNAVSARLLKNQEDIGNAVKPFYGEGAGNRLTTLLKEHITTAVELVQAAKANNQNALSDANDRWYDNANQIASFLSDANPNWKQEDTQKMMKEHLDLTKQEAVNILGNKFEESVTDYDMVHEQILTMADMLSDGIVAQFPDKF